MTKQKTQSSAAILQINHNETPMSERAERVVPATIGLAEAALILGIHKSTAWAMHQNGTFPVPVLKVGSRLRIVKAHLQQFLETGEPVTFASATAKPILSVRD